MFYINCRLLFLFCQPVKPKRNRQIPHRIEKRKFSCENMNKTKCMIENNCEWL